MRELPLGIHSSQLLPQSTAIGKKATTKHSRQPIPAPALRARCAFIVSLLAALQPTVVDQEVSCVYSDHLAEHPLVNTCDCVQTVAQVALAQPAPEVHHECRSAIGGRLLSGNEGSPSGASRAIDGCGSQQQQLGDLLLGVLASSRVCQQGSNVRG